ncbi:hypothetical protein KFE98_02405 [bacterium SCSIO 12741]|nr:hypothetical protein KFE98_02405 [bacterium SCSIO 12741]
MAGFGAIQGMINSYKSNRNMGKNSGSLKKKTDSLRTYKTKEAIGGKKMTPEEFEQFRLEVAEKERQYRLKKLKIFLGFAALVIGLMYLLLFVL